VTGRKCSGSYDFPLSDFFLLEALTFESMTSEPRRGSWLYNHAVPGFVINKNAGFAQEVGRSSLYGDNFILKGTRDKPVNPDSVSLAVS